MQRRGSVLGDRIRIGTCPDKAANDRPSGMGIPRAPARHTVGCIAEWFCATSIVGAGLASGYFDEVGIKLLDDLGQVAR